MKYIHVVKWGDYQRFGDRRVSWVRVHTKLHREENFLDLSGHKRAILLGIWIEYGMNVRADAQGQFTDARGIVQSTASLSRRLNLRVLSPDLEALNQAGFIWFSEHEARQEATQDESLDTQILRHLETTLDDESSESESSECSCGEINSRHCRVHGQDELERADDVDERDADIVLPSSSKPSTFTEPGDVAEAHHSSPAGASRGATPSPGSVNGRPRDDLWDELERLFGVVVDKTSAHGARNKAVRELRLYGATAELVRLAAKRWSSLYPSATLTDSAIAKHWPQLTAGARSSSGKPACSECGMGGGLHVADCPTVAEAPPGDLERFLNDEGTEAA